MICPWLSLEERYNYDSITLILTELNRPSLELYIKGARLTPLYKTQLYTEKLFDYPIQLPSITLPHHFHQIKSVTNSYTIKQALIITFFPRTAPDWDNLPESVVNSLAINFRTI